jgi:hypothetical protein
MPDLEFLVWKRRFSPILLYKFKQPVSPRQPDVAISKFKQPVSPRQPDVAVTKLSRSIEVKPA